MYCRLRMVHAYDAPECPTCMWPFMTENMGLSENMYPVVSEGGLSRKYVHAHDSRCCVVLMTASMPSRTL